MPLVVDAEGTCPELLPVPDFIVVGDITPRTRIRRGDDLAVVSVK